MKGDVLLTGATGLIGGEIAARLMKRGRRVWCLVRSRSFAEAAARLERRFALSGEHCDWSKLVALPGDVTEDFLCLADETIIHLRRECTQIIHGAADTSFAVGNSCHPVNLAGTRNVLNLCALLGPHVRLFHTSSAVVCLEPENPPQGSTGHWPVPSGDPPDGMVGARRKAANCPFLKCITPISVGGSTTDAGESPALPTSRSTLIHEDMPYRGFANDYVRSKRRCEEIVLQSPVDAVILRPSIVLSHGVNSREFARSVAWVMPVIRSLGVLPLRGDERIDLVSVRFVAEAVAEMLERPLAHRIYHLSAGPEAAVSWKELLDALTQGGHDFSDVRFDPDLDWEAFGRAEPPLCRRKVLMNHYLPFLHAGVVYDCSRLKHALGDDFPPCPKAIEYCAQLLDWFTERESFEEALNP
ncbi:MAG: SDR family oxidoreductase [Chloroflexi bacterium]|nr:SDR family oxidoreductase [Chloroflexota bacterium]